MPAAGRKRVEGGLPILSQSVAIGRAETEDKAPKKVAFRRTGRNRSRLVAIGRNRSPAGTEDKAPKKSRFGVPVAIGRNRSRLVAIGRAETEDKAPKKSQSVAIGRAETEDKAQTQKKPDSTIGNRAA